MINADRKPVYRVKLSLRRTNCHPVLTRDDRRKLGLTDRSGPALVIISQLLNRRSKLTIYRTLQQRNLGAPVLLLVMGSDLRSQITYLRYKTSSCFLGPCQTRTFLGAIRLCLRSAPTSIRDLHFNRLALSLVGHRTAHGNHLVRLAVGRFRLLGCLVRRPHRMLRQRRVLRGI